MIWSIGSWRSRCWWWGLAFDKEDDRGLAQKLTETFEEMREDGTMQEIIGTYTKDTDCCLEVRTDET